MPLRGAPGVDPSVVKLSVFFQFVIVLAVLTAATALAYAGKLNSDVVATVFGGALGYTSGSVVRGRTSDAPRANGGANNG